MSKNCAAQPKPAKAGRVVYDDPATAPRESRHWQRLVTQSHHGEASVLVHTHEELLGVFARDVASLKHRTSTDRKEHYLNIATWSCLVGYCEALATHKEERYALFPIPLTLIRDLVKEEFVSLLKRAPASDSENSKLNQAGDSLHRRTVRAVANAVWKRAPNKKSSVQDELHANSLYTCLCGEVDGKSIDCFGAALIVVLGMQILGFGSSYLTLSEDHAYESHCSEGGRADSHSEKKSEKRATCEVAVPGNTKAAQSKRGKEISYTFEQLNRDHITAETSWLYMAKNPVVCDTPGMALAALVGNLNCSIDKQKHGAGNGNKPHAVSASLYKMKRDMLWILHEGGHTATFPFALIELGECEEHLSSPKGLAWVEVPELRDGDRPTLVLKNEKLFLDAIQISRTVYEDRQVYPYLYAGHYHKDAGAGADPSREYRLVEALRLYAEAARVASAYRYDTKDCLQLMKHMTTVAALVANDVLRVPHDCGGNGKDGRTWGKRNNVVAAATWLLSFFDSLLFWEEREQNSFVEVLSIQHKHFLGKLFQLFAGDIRADAIAKMHSHADSSNDELAITEDNLLYFGQPRSKRLAKDSLLVVALSKDKVSVRELEMTVPANSEGRSARQRKRVRV